MAGILRDHGPAQDVDSVLPLVRRTLDALWRYDGSDLVPADDATRQTAAEVVHLLLDEVACQVPDTDPRATALKRLSAEYGAKDVIDFEFNLRAALKAL